MSAATENEELFQCPECSKSYRRREHLQRHRNTHSADRPFACSTCDAKFKRTDILRRHMETCEGRRRLPGAGIRKRRACDRCAQQKKACNACMPCQNCERRGVSCLYSPSTSAATASTTSGENSTVVSNLSWRADGPLNSSSSHFGSMIDPSMQAMPLAMQFGDNWSALIQETVSDYNILDHTMVDMFAEDWPNFMPSTDTTGQLVAPRQSYTDDVPGPVYLFRFLADFTSRTGLVSSFDCGTADQRREVVTVINKQHELHPRITHCIAAPTSNYQTNGTIAEYQPLDSSNVAVVPTSNWELWLEKPLVRKLQQIVARVKEVIDVKPRNSTVTLTWSAVNEKRCLDFFDAPRVTKFLELYWAVWHPNVNFLHRPTFSAADTPSPLLAAMALIGACVSPDAQDNEDAKLWFNCVEEMVFTDDHLCSDTMLTGVDDQPVTSSILANRRKVQALQAAYIVCLYQNWEGTDSSKRRIRQNRFGTMVSVARDIGIGTARHGDYFNQSDHEFNWHEYVAREEQIRTFIWILLLDTAFVIFNNLPPRMVIKEMTMTMASPEFCFQATTSEGCLAQFQQWYLDSKAMCHLTLREAIENLCLQTLTPDAVSCMAELGALNLFAIVSAFHYQIFQLQNLTGVAGQLSPIRTALRNWKKIWDQYGTLPLTILWRNQASTADVTSMWKRIGFSQYCEEYWLLADLLVSKIAQATSQYQFGRSDSIVDENGEVCHARIVEPVLGKIDQTSMQQVNELITKTQNLQFS